VTPYASESTIDTRYDQVYENGNPTSIRGAQGGFEIHVNLKKGLWGFCSQDASNANNCMMVGVCYDDTDRCTSLWIS